MASQVLMNILFTQLPRHTRQKLITEFRKYTQSNNKIELSNQQIFEKLFQVPITQNNEGYFSNLEFKSPEHYTHWLLKYS